MGLGLNGQSTFVEEEDLFFKRFKAFVVRDEFVSMR